MTIVNSVIVWVNVQKDGRQAVLEHHTDQLGKLYNRIYLALAGADLNAALTAYAAILAQLITDAEIASNMAEIIANGSLASISNDYSTAQQNANALRVLYADATNEDAVMMADFLDTLSDAALESAFGLTQAQVATLRTNKLDPAAALATQIRATTGQ